MRFLTPNFEAFSISAILRILKLINASKTHFRLTIQNHVAKYVNHGVNQRQATTANKHGNSTLYSVLFTIYRFYAHWRRPCGGVQRVSRRHGTVPRARRQPRPKYRYPLSLTGGYKSTGNSLKIKRNPAGYMGFLKIRRVSAKYRKLTYAFLIGGIFTESRYLGTGIKGKTLRLRNLAEQPSGSCWHDTPVSKRH